ncbi:unnamed protein product [Mesocestoides corti]|uniref:Uncharacterized protein n=1 Tax=Mesocestoides corti TaxID=53468 RepID=A0A0R3UJN2_MESCO|nr:unnamed protein product [Mesocestoides corti]
MACPNFGKRQSKPSLGFDPRGSLLSGKLQQLVLKYTASSALNLSVVFVGLIDETVSVTTIRNGPPFCQHRCRQTHRYDETTAATASFLPTTVSGLVRCGRTAQNGTTTNQGTRTRRASRQKKINKPSLRLHAPAPPAYHPVSCDAHVIAFDSRGLRPEVKMSEVSFYSLDHPLRRFHISLFLKPPRAINLKRHMIRTIVSLVLDHPSHTYSKSWGDVSFMTHQQRKPVVSESL